MDYLELYRFGAEDGTWYVGFFFLGNEEQLNSEIAMQRLEDVD